MFRFRLQQVLDLREKRERALALQLVQAMSAEQAAQKQLDDLNAARHANVSLAAESGQMRPVGELASLAFVIQQLDGHIENAKKVVTAAAQEVSQVQGALATAHKDRRVLDRLRERHQNEHRAEVEHRDRQIMDDLAITRYMQQGGR
jgi:flagellar FliJ protein